MARHSMTQDEVTLGESPIGDALGELMHFDPHRVNISNVITITARLAQILAEEADLLAEYKIGPVADLQQEKMLLTDALEAQKRLISKNPELLEDITSEERDDLREVVAVFNQVLAENFRRLTMARAVNEKVVEAIKEVAAEYSQKGTYDRKGSPDTAEDALSVTLNKTI